MSADVILLELSIPHYLHVGASPPVIDSGRKKLQLQRRGSVHDDALDMFLYTVLLTGSSLLHLTNITYVHNNDQKYINICLSVESSPKDGLGKGESLMMCTLRAMAGISEDAL